jgi:thiosulfate/3-mercaptopyruvate sulfurtransferase
MSRADVLVDGDWLASRLGDPDLVVLEVDERPLVYRLGHIPGAHCLDWRVDLQDPVARDIPGRDAIGRLWRRVGVTDRSTVVFYGDKGNWYACFGFWLFRLFGARDLRLLDGGRQSWIVEGRPLTLDEPRENVEARPRSPRASSRHRATWRDVAESSLDGAQLLDVRTPEEYRGDVLTEPGYPEEGAQRPGHVPGALSTPWDLAVGVDGRLRPDDQLRLILSQRGVRLDHDTITYCRIGERSAHTWFVLSELLAVPTRNYDGSWAEWGSMIGMPVALGDEPGRADRDLRRIAGR